MARSSNTRVSQALIFLSLLLFSCTTKFDKAKWQQESDIGQFPYREKMVNDLVVNHKLKGLTYNQVIDLIGEPQKNLVVEKNKINYPIIVEYENDIDPVYTKTLVITINDDSLVSTFQIDEWKK